MSSLRTELIYQTQNYISKTVEKNRELNKPIFINQEKLFKNLNIVDDEEKEIVLQSASSGIDGHNYAENKNPQGLIIETDLSPYHMLRAKVFTLCGLNANKFNEYTKDRNNPYVIELNILYQHYLNDYEDYDL